MKKMLAIVVALFSFSGVLVADDQKKIIDALDGIEMIDKCLVYLLQPIRRADKESEKDYLKRVKRVLKGRALYVHFVHQELERALSAKYRLEVAGEKTKDERAKSLEAKAEKLSKLVPSILEGLEVVEQLETKDDYARLIVLHNKKTKKAFGEYQKK